MLWIYRVVEFYPNKEFFGGAFAQDKSAAPSFLTVEQSFPTHLTEKGFMDAGTLYEQPFTGLHYEGLDGVFPSAVADEIVSIIELINANANISAAA